MYFAKAIYLVMSGIGLFSCLCFIGMVLNLDEEEKINRQIGYQNYFIILGTYALVAVPLAATINNGGSDILFFIGCFSPAVLAIANRLANQHAEQRAAEIAALAQPVTQAAPATWPMSMAPDQPSYTPAPTTLVNDFDVPPQR